MIFWSITMVPASITTGTTGTPIAALITIGVLCDNEAIFNEGVEYYKNGKGNGSIYNAVPYMHGENLGQWQESGRDQQHAQLGVGFMATSCQIAWNQGIDLFGYADNRLLAGAEYENKPFLPRFGDPLYAL